MLVESGQLKKMLMEALHENRALAPRAKGSTGQAYINAHIAALEKILIFVDKSEKAGEMDMEKGKAEIIAKVVTIGELAPRKVMKDTEEKIIRFVGALMGLMDVWESDPKSTPQSRPALELHGLTWGHFSNKTHNLRKDGKIDPRIGPMKRGKQMFLVRHDEPIQGRSKSNKNSEEK